MGTVSGENGWENPKTTLARHAGSAKKRYSQNFLTDEGISRKIVRLLRASKQDHILEIGPGPGTLTRLALADGLSISAIEFDPEMCAILRTDLGVGFDLTEQDATTVDWRSMTPQPTLLLGNLPYAITGQLLRRIVEHRDHIERAVIMVQREVADRLNGEVGTKAYGIPTIMTSATFSIRSAIKVPPHAFSPQPKVHSAVVVLERRQTPRAQVDDMFTRVVKAAFGRRRKTLRNALSTAFEANMVRAALSNAVIDEKRRGETLCVEEFDALANSFRLLSQSAAPGSTSEATTE